MPCPFFLPLSPLGRDHWSRPPRFPLGEAYRGLCRAQAEPFVPPEPSLEDLCNCGYARGRCDRVPAGSADAVRFSIVAENETSIRVVYVFERAHAPETHGVIEYSKASEKIENADGILLAQAAAFLRSYLSDPQRAGEPPRPAGAVRWR